MSLSQWTSVITPASGITVSIETTSPLVGTGSLRLQRSGSGMASSFTYPTDIALPTGFTKGRLQTQFRLDSITADNASNQLASLFFMVSSITSPLTTASMYGFSAACRTSDGIVQFFLGKTIGGGSISISNQLGSVDIADIPSGTTITMQVDWVYDLLQFAGTQIKARYKIGTDYVGMTTVFNYTDTSSPLSTSVAEGLGLVTPIGASVYDVFFDETSLFDLIAS